MRARMIKLLIEGPDGNGKSTLLEDLGDMFPTMPIKYLSRPENRSTMDNRIRHLLFSDIRCDRFDILAWDRHPIISEQVYGPILRGRTVVTKELMVAAVNAFATVKTNLIIFCMTTTGPESMVEKERKSTIYKQLINNYPQIMDAYYQIWMETPLIYHYDWQEPGALSRLAKRIVMIQNNQFVEEEINERK